MLNEFPIVLGGASIEPYPKVAHDSSTSEAQSSYLRNAVGGDTSQSHHIGVYDATA